MRNPVPVIVRNLPVSVEDDAAIQVSGMLDRSIPRYYRDIHSLPGKIFSHTVSHRENLARHNQLVSSQVYSTDDDTFSGNLSAHP